jgi:HAD superfamily hydrolase (TIGR01509 family)
MEYRKNGQPGRGGLHALFRDIHYSADSHITLHRFFLHMDRLCAVAALLSSSRVVILCGVITTVIFDLDGLLADTERLHCRAYQDALKCYGAALTETEYGEHWVRSGLGIADWVSIRGLTVDPVAVRARKSERYLELVAISLQPMNGALALLQSLHGKKTLALASSSYRDAVDAVLRGLDITHYFKAVISGLDVARVKPAPDIFLAAARAVGASPSECLVLEDAEKGVLAAYEAGMACIAVPNEHTRHHDFSRAIRVCASLNEITLELIEQLVGLSR